MTPGRDAATSQLGAGYASNLVRRRRPTTIAVPPTTTRIAPTAKPIRAGAPVTGRPALLVDWDGVGAAALVLTVRVGLTDADGDTLALGVTDTDADGVALGVWVAGSQVRS